MKTLRFKELLLVSNREKKGRRIRFHPTMTVVRGNNETGKSSLIKSLFSTFGAEPAKIHPAWRDADVRSLLHFEIGGRKYSILRYGDRYAIFNEKGKLTGSFRSITNEFAPFFSRLVEFGLRFPSRGGSLAPLPPAYYFLPYYMDQDVSWSDPWCGFARLAQFQNWKKGVIEYHAGIRGNEYYEAFARRNDAETQVKKIIRKREGLEEIYTDLSKRFGEAQFSVDFKEYAKEVDVLLAKCDVLRRREEEYKVQIAELRNQKQSLEVQIKIACNAKDETRSDFDHAEVHGGDDVECPLCGALYANSFAERFSIAMDEDRYAGLLLELTEEVNKLDERILKVVAEDVKISEEISEIEQLLARREGEVALVDLIQREGRRELRSVMVSDIEKLLAEEEVLQRDIVDATNEMKGARKTDRRKEVNEFFSGILRKYLFELEVFGVRDSSILKVDAAIKATGSELPRALLARQMAFFDVICKFGSSVVAPLVIDSPNQQDQDSSHLGKILGFIGGKVRPDHQTILGLVDTCGVNFDCYEIVLEKKYSLLLEKEYDDTFDELMHYIDGALGNN